MAKNIDYNAVLKDFCIDVENNPNFTDDELFSAYPEFNNDKSMLDAAWSYYNTKKANKYDDKTLRSKFPEFFGKSTPPTGDWVTEPMDDIDQSQIDTSTSEQPQDNSNFLRDTLGKGLLSGIVRAGNGLLSFLNRANASQLAYAPQALAHGRSIEEADRLRTQYEQADAELYNKINDYAERLSSESKPYNGQYSFTDLLFRKGEVGKALKQGVSTTMESLPYTLSALNPLATTAMVASMTEQNYRQSEQENPDMSDSKRLASAVGNAAIEMAVERIGNPFKGLKGGVSARAAGAYIKQLKNTAKDGIAKGIARIVGEGSIEAGKEGVEEIVTTIGQDLWNTLLDWKDENGLGLKSQYAKAKQENPNLTAGEFAAQKAEGLANDFIGGALSGVVMSAPTTGVQVVRNAKQFTKQGNAQTQQAAQDQLDIMNTVAKQTRTTDADVAQAIIDKRDGKPLSEQQTQLIRYYNAQSEAVQIQRELTELYQNNYNKTNGQMQAVSIIGEENSEYFVISGNLNYTEENGEVKIDLLNSDDYVVVRDQNTGKVRQIRTQELQHIFAGDANEMYADDINKIQNVIIAKMNLQEGEDITLTSIPTPLFGVIDNTEAKVANVDGDGNVTLQVQNTDGSVAEVQMTAEEANESIITPQHEYSSLSYQNEEGDFAIVTKYAAQDENGNPLHEVIYTNNGEGATIQLTDDQLHEFLQNGAWEAIDEEPQETPAESTPETASTESEERVKSVSGAFNDENTTETTKQPSQFSQQTQQIIQTLGGNLDLSKASLETTIKETEKSIQKLTATLQKGVNLRDTKALEKYQAQQAQLETERQELAQYKSMLEEVRNEIDRPRREEKAAQEARRQAAKAAEIEQQKQTDGTAAEKYVNSPKIDGNTATRTLPNGTKLAGHYVLVSPNALTPSHDPFNGWQSSKGFPLNPETGKNINDRDYEKDKSAQQVTLGIAQTYDGQAVAQVPTVSPDGIVYDGNGRTMAGQIAAANGTDAAYTEALVENAAQFGFSPEQLQSIPNARVVFQTDEVLPYTTDTFAQFNANEKKSQSNTNKARAISKRLTDEQIFKIAHIIDQYGSLKSLFESDNGVSDMLKLLREETIISDNDMAAILDENGRLSATGRELLENIFIGSLFNEDELSLINASPSMRQSVLRALKVIAQNAKMGEFALKDEISGAIRLVAEAKGMPVIQYLYQTEMNFDSEEQATVQDRYDETSQILAMDLDKGVEDFRDLLTNYNKAAENAKGGQLDMLTGEVMTKEELQEQLNTWYKNGHKEEFALAKQRAGQQPTVQPTEQPAAQGESAGLETGNVVGSVPTDSGNERGGQANSGHLGERGDSATQEVDENGSAFVKSPDGTTIFGEIKEDSGLTPAPIKLSEGYQSEDGKGYGLAHIEANHGEQIRKAGFASVEEFVSYVATNYDVDNIRVGKRRDGNSTFLIQVSDEHDNTLFIELSHDGSYWGVNSGGIFRKGYANKKETVVKTEPQQPNNAISDDSSRSEDNTGIAPSAPNGEPTVSADKDTADSSPVQETKQKSDKKGENGAKTLKVNDGVTLSELAQEEADIVYKHLPDVLKDRVSVRSSSTGYERMQNFIQEYDIDGKPSGIYGMALFNGGSMRFYIEGLNPENENEFNQYLQAYEEYRKTVPHADEFSARTDYDKISFATFAEAYHFLQFYKKNYGDNPTLSHSVKPATSRAGQRAQKQGKLYGLNNIEVVETETDLAQISQQAVEVSRAGAILRAFYDHKNGKIYFYLPGIKRDAKESGKTTQQVIDELVMHEALTHKGLRAMLGERAGEFFGATWNTLDEQQRNEWAQYAWDYNLHNPAGRRKIAGTTDDWADLTTEQKAKVMADASVQQNAADEYIAHLAEKIDAGTATRDERTLWRKFVDALYEFLNKHFDTHFKTSADLIADKHRNMSASELINLANSVSRNQDALAKLMHDSYTNIRRQQDLQERNDKARIRKQAKQVGLTKQQTDDMISYSTVWHGSPHSFNTEKSDFGKDNLKYVDKEKAIEWLGLTPPEGASTLTPQQQYAAKVIQNFENPKLPTEFSTPQQPFSAKRGQDLITGSSLDSEISFSIGNKKKQEYRSQLLKNGYKEEDADGLLLFLHELPDTKDNIKVIKLSTHWANQLGRPLFFRDKGVCKHFVRQVSDAIMVSEIEGIDPMQYAHPLDITEKYPETLERIQSRERINPDDVPTLTNKREYAYGVTVYDVFDWKFEPTPTLKAQWVSEKSIVNEIEHKFKGDIDAFIEYHQKEADYYLSDEYKGNKGNADADLYQATFGRDIWRKEQSRRNMRAIINSHLGLNTSPWCLLQGDDNGELTEHSGEYWDRYNSIPKKVAFQNGKLIAFCAHDSLDREGDTWWDRHDEPSNNIPLRDGTYMNPDGEIEGKKDSYNDIYSSHLDNYYDEALFNVANDMADWVFRDIAHTIYSKSIYEYAPELRNSDSETIMERIQERVEDQIRNSTIPQIERLARERIELDESNEDYEEKLSELIEKIKNSEEYDDIYDRIRDENEIDWLDEEFEALSTHDKKDIIRDFAENNYDGVINQTNSYDILEDIRAEQESLWSDNGGTEEYSFSVKKPVEQRGDLIAVHNLNEKEVHSALGLGGLAMPSIAITSKEVGHDKFGDISFVFDKQTIDPQANRANHIYDRDAWTPSFPGIGVKVNRDVAIRVIDKINELTGDSGITDSYLRDTYNIDDKLVRSQGDVLGSFGNSGALKLAYLRAKGKKLKFPTKEKVYSRTYGNDFIRKLLNSLQEKGVEIPSIDTRSEYFDNNETSPAVQVIHEALKQRRLSSITDDMPALRVQKIRENAEKLTYNEFDNVVYAIRQMERDLRENKGKIPTEIDFDAAYKAIDAAMPKNRKDYEQWVMELFDGIIEKRGIRNSKDWYTPSGTRRSFEQLHDDVNLHNIVAAMLRQNQRGGSGGFFNSDIFGASAKELKSISAIRKEGKARLHKINSEEEGQRRTNILERFSNIERALALDSSFDDMFNSRNLLIEAISQSHDAEGIYRYMHKWRPKFTMGMAQEVEDIIQEIGKMNVPYFEAKPRRAVGFDEVRLAVVPKGTSKDLIEQMKQAGVERIKTYDPKKEGNRAEVLNKAVDDAGISFSVKPEADINAVNDKFNEQLAQFTPETADKTNFNIGNPSPMLLNGGVVNKPMKLYGAKLLSKIKKHGIDVSELKDLPLRVAEPIAVFNTHGDISRAILTELQTKQGNILVTVTTGRDRDIEFNIISSTHSKDFERIVQWINNGCLTNVDKEKALNWLAQSSPKEDSSTNQGANSASNDLGTSAPIADTSSSSMLNSAAKIVQEFDTDKFFAKNLDNEAESQTDPTISFSVTPATYPAALQHAILRMEEATKAREDTKAILAKATSAKLRELNHLISTQRKVDATTISELKQLAISHMGKGDSLSHTELRKLLGDLETAVSSTRIEKVQDAAIDILDILADNRVSQAIKLLNTQLKGIRPTKRNQSGVSVMGNVGGDMQYTLETLKDAIHQHLTADQVQKRIDTIDTGEELTAEQQARIDGYEAYQHYLNTVQPIQDDLNILQEQLRNETNTAVKRTLRQAIVEARTELANAHTDFALQLYNYRKEGASARSSFLKAKKEHKDKLHNYANSDMQGIKASVNSNNSRFHDFIGGLNSPLRTLNSMLRLFGRNSANGNGYLHQHFIPALNKAYGDESDGIRAANDKLDELAKTYKGCKSWADLIREVSKLPTIECTYMDYGEQVNGEIHAGNALYIYIYMANKMLDGQMKLSKMGITDDTVKAIKDSLPAELIEIADKIQGELLPELRKKYNAVHRKLFGCDMTTVPNYFPLRIAKGSLRENVDVSQEQQQNMPSNITGAIIRRTRNTKPLDILNTDALALTLEHITEMEKWAAFASVNEDINAILSYAPFRQKVKQMRTIYGSGDALWKAFKDACKVAVDSYQTTHNDLDDAFMNIQRGIIVSRIAFNLNSALKQVLSLPAVIGNSDIKSITKSLINPVGSWKWCMENLPTMRRRWEQGLAGNTHVNLEKDIEWKMWQTRIADIAQKVGMAPNKFVDMVICTAVAKSCYDTVYRQSKKAGFSEEEANRRAIQAADIAYNESQQSNLGAYVSPIQRNKHIFHAAISAYQNSNFAYGRLMVESITNLSRLARNHDQILAFEQKRLERQGLTTEQAETEAKRILKRETWKSIAKLAIYGFVMNLVWQLGNSMWYLAFGDDEKDKKKTLRDATYISLVRSSSQNIPIIGSGLSAGIEALLNGKSYDIFDSSLPMFTELNDIYKGGISSGDMIRIANDCADLLSRATLGVSEEYIANMAMGIYDACNMDAPTARKALHGIMAIMNAPKSSQDKIFVDEAMKALRSENYKKVVNDYYEFIKTRKEGFLSPAVSDEQDKKLQKKAQTDMKKKAKDRLNKAS